MRNLIKLGLVLVLATALASLALFDNGQISMVWHDWVIETSITFALAAVFILFSLLYLIVRLALNLISLPHFLKKRRQFIQYAKGEALMSKGLLALEYGDWKTAEKQLIKTAKKSDAGLVHYLNAAKMAHNQGAFARRNQYLEEARKRFPEEYIVIGLVESRLLQQESPALAETILAELQAQNPRDKVLLAEYAHILGVQKKWLLLEVLLPQLKKFKALPKEEIVTIELSIQAGKLMASDDLVGLESVWFNLPQSLQKQPQVLAEYVEKRFAWGEEGNLAHLIEQALAKRWDDRLAYQYGRIQLGPAFERLRKAEIWSKKYPNNPVLLLTLGRLACMSQLWGQGQYFLKQSLSLQPEVETYHALAMCYEAEGQTDEAALIYKEAILKLDEKVA